MKLWDVCGIGILCGIAVVDILMERWRAEMDVSLMVVFCCAVLLMLLMFYFQEGEKHY